MSSKIIVLDPGHGLDDKGNYQRPLIDCTSGKAIIVADSMKPHPNDHSPNFYREDFGTLEIAKETKKALEALGHKVLLTRNDNRQASAYLGDLSGNEWKKKFWQSWKWTVEYTKQSKADMFISIHTNAGRGTGCSAFWANPPHGLTLCQNICGEINKQLNLKIRKIDQHRYLILRDVCNSRAVLVECLFHDNYDDIKLLLNQQGIQKMAKALATGINSHAETF
jgi:N-acetylmuramoyl-L-alanine amidase